MMENHSFDNLAGYWDFHEGINGLNNITFCNSYTNPNYTVYNESLQVCAGPYEQEVPLNDPDHDFAGTSYEIYQLWNPTNADTPTMGGFVERESDVYNSTPGDADFVIKAATQEHSNILATIGQNFAFWDTYVSIESSVRNGGSGRPLTPSSMRSILGQQTLTVKWPLPALLVVLSMTPPNPPGSSTMSLGLTAACPFSKH